MNKYLLKETYEQIKKIQILKDYTITIKDQFLTPELWQVMINSFDEELKTLKTKLKNLQD